MYQATSEKFSISKFHSTLGILEIYENEQLDEADVELFVRELIDLTKDNNYSFAVYFRSFSSISMEALDIFIKGFDIVNTKKIAIITNQLEHFIHIRFYFNKSKTNAQFRIFSNDSDAFDWLDMTV